MGAFKNPLATAFRLGHSDLKMPVGKSSAAAALPGREGAHRGGGAVRGRAWAGVAANKFSRSLNATNLFRKHAAAMAPMNPGQASAAASDLSPVAGLGVRPRAKTGKEPSARTLPSRTEYRHPVHEQFLPNRKNKKGTTESSHAETRFNCAFDLQSRMSCPRKLRAAPAACLRSQTIGSGVCRVSEILEKLPGLGQVGSGRSEE